jgi:hypothetical protein
MYHFHLGLDLGLYQGSCQFQETIQGGLSGQLSLVWLREKA